MIDSASEFMKYQDAILDKAPPLSVSLAAQLESRLHLQPMGLTRWWVDGLMVIKRSRSLLASHHEWLCAFILGSIALVLCTMTADLEILSLIRCQESPAAMSTLHRAAKELSYWGDFLGFNLAAFIALGFTARVRCSPLFRRLVIVAVIGTTTCGGLANVCRALTGRARPSYQGAAGFHGPTLKSGLQSFPSAHTATCFGASLPVAVALPQVGVPMLLVSAGIAWSRMYNNQHHPADVLMSVLLSVLIGLPLGLVVRRMRPGGAHLRRTKIMTSDQLVLAPLNPSRE